MSDSADKLALPADMSLGQVAPMSAGALLRQAREAAGLHIAALAVTLKVPVKKLEALEANRIDLLPDAVFARALAASVCRTLKTDPAPILAGLPQTNLAHLQSQSKVTATAFSAPNPETRNGPSSSLSKPVVFSALALIIAALVIVLFPASEGLLSTLRSVGIGAPAKPASTPSAVPQVLPGDGNFQPPLLASTSLAASGLPDAVAAKTDPASGSLGPVSVAPSLGATESGTDTAAATLGEIVVLKSKGSAWVEVLDGKRAVRLRKTMLPGESVGVSAELPLYVTLGRADTIEVQVRGKPLDLAPLTKDNVARFEVRQ